LPADIPPARSGAFAIGLACCMAFSLLAIFVSCLGLFGLATFTIGQRTKEIGIRKVLGASVTSILTLLSKDFVKLVTLAMLIAIPVAAWATQ
jgi:putative ABC transport system permease protein